MELLPRHFCHDDRRLLQAWRRVARAAGVRLSELPKSKGSSAQPIIWLESSAVNPGVAVRYLSAGVHGDEPAAAWGLLGWAEQHVERLRHQPIILFPCLNPEGLRANNRLDVRGQDLNRCFHQARHPVCSRWRRVLADRRLSLAICLHEDYDAQGCYVYELQRRADAHWGAALLAQAATQDLPVDPRREIDGMRAQKGVIQRHRVPTHLPGLPEAIVLHQLGCEVSLTFETPSEFSLDHRVAAQARFIEAAMQRQDEEESA